MSIENCENCEKNNYTSSRIRAGAGSGAGTCRARNCRGTAGSQEPPGSWQALRRGTWRGFCLLPFVPLLCWLYILRFFRLFRFFSITLLTARHFLKIGGKFAPCWACASNQAERIAKNRRSTCSACLLLARSFNVFIVRRSRYS